MSGLRVQGSGFEECQGFGFRSFRLRAVGVSGLRVQGSGFEECQGFGFRSFRAWGCRSFRAQE